MTHRPGKQARKTAALLFSFATFIALELPLSAKPSGLEIVVQARDMIRAQDVSLTGKLRTGPDNIPFVLTQRGGVSTYVFRDPAETIRVQLGESGVKIAGVDNTATPIRNSVLTYDDLALRFLYWTSIDDLGEEKLRSLPCWKLRLNAPDKSSPYAFVKLWVNVQSGAFIRAQAFDWSGVLAKQFEVISTQSIEGRTFLKSLKIQLSKPLPPNPETLSYLEIERPS